MALKVKGKGSELDVGVQGKPGGCYKKQQQQQQHLGQSGERETLFSQQQIAIQRSGGKKEKVAVMKARRWLESALEAGLGPSNVAKEETEKKAAAAKKGRMGCGIMQQPSPDFWKNWKEAFPAHFKSSGTEILASSTLH